jgi:hypothetical protein
MERVQLLRTEFGDAFLFLPLLILGFSFLYGLLTSNIGLLALFLGELTVVPSLGFLMNEKNPFQDGMKMVVTLASVAAVFGTLLATGAYGWIVLPIFLAIGKYVGKNPEASLFDYVNLPTYFGWLPTADPSPSCAIVPGVTDPWSNPSVWSLHITFFSGYILANAISLYNQPPPTLDDPTPHQKSELETRVGNRKTIAATAGAISLLVCFILLWLRFTKTPCETSWILQIIPLAFALYVGTAAFTLAASCGARPADVLGLVQGMVQTTPTVCVAS